MIAREYTPDVLITWCTQGRYQRSAYCAGAASADSCITSQGAEVLHVLGRSAAVLPGAG
jgi:hypothetical protein